MKILWFIMAMCLVVGCGKASGTPIKTPEALPLEVKIANDSTADARIKKLEARVEQLENWAVNFGGRMK